MAGLLATFTFLPTAIPVGWQMIRAEEVLALRRTEAAARSFGWLAESGRRPEPQIVAEAEVDWLSIPSIAVDLGDPALRGHDLAFLCAENGPRTIQADDRLWAVACVEQGDIRVFAASRIHPARQAQLVMGLVLLLAVVVGIVTALGVLRLLRPLSDVSRALHRVGEGERGVRMPRTGLAELDELVDRLNAAAREMEDREDGILARIELVQEMARLVAHEVRNPLQSLELLTSLIASESDERERLDIANSIHQEIHTLETVVNRLLRESAISGALRLQRQPQSVATLVEQVVALRRPEANARSMRLSTGVLADRLVLVDAALLKRSIENLVINAMQAVPRRSGEVSISVLEEEPHLVIAVDDNGPGVDPTLAETIFDAHVTTKERGTGLGLTLVKGVVEAHNGYIRVVRSPLGGARFEVRIPLDGEENSEQGAAQNRSRR